MAHPTRSSTAGGGRSVVARALAALGLVACGVAIFVLVSGTMSDSDDGGERDRERSPRPERVEKEPRQDPPPETYVVATGDTLTSISQTTGVSMRRLQQLNPELDAATINAGQVVRLSPE